MIAYMKLAMHVAPDTVSNCHQTICPMLCTVVRVCVCVRACVCVCVRACVCMCVQCKGAIHAL